MVPGPAVPECGCPMKCLHPAERKMKYCGCVEEVGVGGGRGEGGEEDHDKGKTMVA